MSGSLSLIIFLSASVVPEVILLYAGYWAFSIRRSLFTGVYRSQAFWIGFFGVYFVPYVSPAFNLVHSNPLVEYFVGATYYIVLAFLIFRLVDVDVQVARRSDPLLRDTLHWKRLRLVVWLVMVVSAAFALYFLAIQDLFPGLPRPGSALFLSQGGVYVPFLVTGAPALLLSANRSKDPYFRGTLMWFGLFFLGFLAIGIGYLYSTVAFGQEVISGDVLSGIGTFVFAFMAYCLYRSARSLVPLNRIPSDGT